MQEFDLDNRPLGLPAADDRFPRVLAVTEEGDSLRLRLHVAENLCWFRGHFPEQPVLAGIVQLHWAVTVVQACFGFSAPPVAIKRLKFKQVVTPPAEMELTVSLQGSRESRFRFAVSDGENSEGCLVFAEDARC